MIDHPIRGRLNAWMLDAFDEDVHRVLGPFKGRLFERVPSTLIELGAGAGANFRYFPAGTRVIAIEPNVRMHPRLQRNATEHELSLELVPAYAERLPFPAASVDMVLATLVFCSVGDPAAVVAEVRRVLRPGGRLVCLEHVAAPDGSFTASVQRFLRRPWRWVFEGCDLRNHTPDILRSAGFSDVRIEPLNVPELPSPIRHLIVATCTA